MIVNIKATGTTLTASLRSYIEKKLAPIGKLVKGDEDSAVVQVEIGRSTKHHKKGDVYYAEINVRLGKTKLRAEKNEEDIYAAIDGAKDEILRELKSYKSKTEAKQKAGGRKVKGMLKG